MFTHDQVDWIYFVAFACTAAGIIIYSYKYGSLNPLYLHFSYGRNLASLYTWFSILLRLIPLVARRSSREVEETAQVTGASDEKGKEGDEEAGAHYPV